MAAHYAGAADSAGGDGGDCSAECVRGTALAVKKKRPQLPAAQGLIHDLVYENISFTLSKMPRACGTLSTFIDSLSWRISSFCCFVSFAGVCTRISTIRSPRPCELRCGTPLPRRRNSLPLCVPSGTL